MTSPRGDETGLRGAGLVGHAQGDLPAVDAPPDKRRGKVSRKGKRQRANRDLWEHSQQSDREAAETRRRARLSGDG